MRKTLVGLIFVFGGVMQAIPLLAEPATSTPAPLWYEVQINGESFTIESDRGKQGREQAEAGRYLQSCSPCGSNPADSFGHVSIRLRIARKGRRIWQTRQSDRSGQPRIGVFDVAERSRPILGFEIAATGHSSCFWTPLQVRCARTRRVIWILRNPTSDHLRHRPLVGQRSVIGIPKDLGMFV